MLLPSTGDLLHGLRQSLKQTVLPEVPDGAASRQLKAALHLLGRLERSWDLAGAHLAQDNADIEAVLGELLPQEGEQSLEARLSQVQAEPPGGFNDVALRAAATRNLALHAIVADLPDCAQLQALRQRMVERDSVYIGDKAPGQEGPK